MGVVYEAEQISLRRRVALKVLPLAAAMDPKQLQRFKNEALAAASLEARAHRAGLRRRLRAGRPLLRHAVHRGADAGPADRRPARPKEAAAAPSASRRRCRYKPGTDAADAGPVAALSTENGSAPATVAFYRRAAELIAQAADALEHAHGLGIVHRDVKPGNLLVDERGKLYVSDFGLARFGPDAGLTMTGDLLGTLRYMAPEQALARHGLVDHRADVYGLGCTLYELLTGRPAVVPPSEAEILRQIAFEEPTAPRKLDRAIPAELETVTLKCLAKNPAERYASAGELADGPAALLGRQADPGPAADAGAAGGKVVAATRRRRMGGGGGSAAGRGRPGRGHGGRLEEGIRDASCPQNGDEAAAMGLDQPAQRPECPR